MSRYGAGTVITQYCRVPGSKLKNPAWRPISRFHPSGVDESGRHQEVELVRIAHPYAALERVLQFSLACHNDVGDIKSHVL